MTIFTLAKLRCLVYYRNHKLCILMPLSILSDNYSHHIDIQHLHGLLHCGFLNFVFMWLHNRTGNRNIFYLHWPLICGTWNRIYLSHWLHLHGKIHRGAQICSFLKIDYSTDHLESFSLRPICFRRRNRDYTQQLCEHRQHLQEYHKNNFLQPQLDQSLHKK